MPPDFPVIFEILIVSYLGLLFGSFASALVYRIPRDIPWIWDKGQGASRSNCTSCGYKLKFLDLIPLLSWIFLKGKCRSCGAKISAIYPLIELTTLSAFLVVYMLVGLGWGALFIYMMLPFLVALLYIDLEHFILPDELVGLVALCGVGHLAAQYYLDQPEINFINQHLIGAVVFAFVSWALGFVMTKILKKDALGFGDVKFFGAVGLWLGITQLPPFMILSGALGILLALAWKIIKKEDVFPFGPALILSFFTLLFFDGSQFF